MWLSDHRLLNYAQRLRRLRYLAIGFLLLLLIPLATLLYFGFGQIKENLLNEYQREASSLVETTNRVLFKRRMLTNSLPVDVFDYYQQVYNPITKQSQQVLSPLSQLEVAQPIPWLQINGLVGYFQYNSAGEFNSPIWPYPFSENSLMSEASLDPELLERKETTAKIYQILSQSKSVQQLFKQDLVVDKQLFNMTLDVPDYLIFYRIVSVANQNRVQGYLVERKPHLSTLFTEKLAESRFNSPVLMEVKDVEYFTHTEAYFYQNLDDNKNSVSLTQSIDKHFQQYPIYKTRLRWPYSGYSVSLSTNSLPMTPAIMYSSIFIII